MRNLRNALAIALPLFGTVLVFAAVLVPAIAVNLQLQIVVVLVGILIIEAGVWRLTAKILPNERRFLALRAEVESFIDRVRILNAQGVRLRENDTEENREALRETVDALHLSVDRMAEVAGRASDTGRGI